MNLSKSILFNPISNHFLNVANKLPIQGNKRIASFILELMYITSVWLPFLFISVILGIWRNNPILNTIANTMAGLLIVSLLNKDMVSGQSPVKRLLGFQVVDKKTEIPASDLKCMIRNVTTFIWPIEAIFYLFNRHRKLGDYLTRTKLIEVKATNPELILDDIKNRKFGFQSRITLAISIIIAILITFMLINL